MLKIFVTALVIPPTGQLRTSEPMDACCSQRIVCYYVLHQKAQIVSETHWLEWRPGFRPRIHARVALCHVRVAVWLRSPSLNQSDREGPGSIPGQARSTQAFILKWSIKWVPVSTWVKIAPKFYLLYSYLFETLVIPICSYFWESRKR